MLRNAWIRYTGPAGFFSSSQKIRLLVDSFVLASMCLFQPAWAIGFDTRFWLC
jgi:hypothetical protein